jgi:uncharacterized protein YoxC
MEGPVDFCPYVGLRPFTVAEQAFFFGRRSETRVVAANLFAAPLTVFYGPSAVGKSSVLQAGVIPQLRRERKTAVLYFRDWPHEDYLNRLKAECASAIALAQDSPLEIDHRLPLNQWIDTALEQFRGQLHLLLDQFEEYLLYHTDFTGTSFDGELAAAINRRDVGAHFLIGLREDGLAKLDRLRKRIPNLLGNTLRLRRLSMDAAREAIEGPLRVYNERPSALGQAVEIDSDLVNAILEEVRAEHLNTAATAGEGSVKSPDSAAEIETTYLQLVMERLWRERTPVNGRLVMQREAFTRLGGAKAISKRHFDEHLQRLAESSDQVDDMVYDLFSHLVTPTGSKISQKEGDLLALTTVPADRVHWFLRELVGARLLRVTDPPERYEIFHDALAKPFLDARNAIVLKRETAAREAELKRVKAMADAQQARAEAEALRVAEQRQATKRFKRLAFGAIALAIAALASAAFAWWSMHEAQTARQQAEAAQSQAEQAEARIADITKRTSQLANEQQQRIADLNEQIAKSGTLTAEERKRMLADAQAESAKSKAELDRLNAQLQQAQRPPAERGTTTSKELEDARKRASALETQLKASQSDVERLRTEIDKLTIERNDLRDSLSRTSTTLKTAQNDIERLKGEVADLTKKLAAATARPEPPKGREDPKPIDKPPDPPPATGDYRALYAAGIRAFDFKQWDEAAKNFGAAAQLKGDADERVRILGMRQEPYIPNYYLGQAYRELGRCDEALRAWAQSEKQGVIQKNSSEHKRLLQGRTACQPK